MRPEVTGDLSTVGTADVVFLGVKAHGLTALAPGLRQLYGPHTVVVSTQNGIPWWDLHGHGGELDGLPLEHVDPGGVIAAAIEPERVVGSLAYFATDIAEPGVIHHTEGNKLSLGEPNDTLRAEQGDRLHRASPGPSSMPTSMNDDAVTSDQVHPERDLVVAIAAARHHEGQMVEDAFGKTLVECQPMRRREVNPRLPFLGAACSESVFGETLNCMSISSF